MEDPGKKEDTEIVFEFPYMKPPDMNWKEKIKNFIYNPRNGSFFGRKPKSWGQLLMFYCIFYSVLAGMFAVCMHNLLLTIDSNFPKLQLKDSFIGTSPGMAFRPMSTIFKEDSLICYDTKSSSSVTMWNDLVDEFLKPYKVDSKPENSVPCSFKAGPKIGKICEVDLTSFGKCTAATKYGYNTTSPCVFLKLNRIFGWTPDFYNNTNELPENMPADLKETIINTPLYERNQVWVSCSGEYPDDKGNATKFEYFPRRGFASYYYPYKNDKNYLSPLIAVKIVDPPPSVMINIECRSWAKNIKYRGGKLFREGSIFFSLMVDV